MKQGSRIINVFSPGHGLTSGTTYRFRGPCAGSSFTYANPQNFDGITGANISKSAGMQLLLDYIKQLQQTC